MKPLIPLITFFFSFCAGAQNNCADSSSHFRYQSQLNDSFRIVKTILTRNNDKVAIGFFLNGPQWSNAFITRVNRDGTIAWFKKFTSTFDNTNVTLGALAEASNGNIFVAANNINSGDKPFSYLVFSPGGNIILQREWGIPGNPHVLTNATHTSLITPFGTDSLLMVLIHAASATTSDGMTLLTVSNAGAIGQAVTFIPPILTSYSSRYSACRTEGNNILLYGGTQFVNSCKVNTFDQPAYAALQIDWNSKQVVSQKVFCSPPVGNDPFGNLLSEGIDNRNTAIYLLANGNTVFARRIWGLDYNGGDTLTRIFKVSIFDPAFNHIKSEYICTRKKFKWWQDWDYELYIDAEGTRYITANDLPGQKIYYAVGNEAGQFSLQKEMPFTSGGKNNFQNIFQLQEPGYLSFGIVSSGAQRSYIDNIRVLAKDTAASCFGTNFDFLTVRPASVSPLSWPGNFIVQQAVIASSPLTFSVANYGWQRDMFCNIVHKCDTIKLNGPSIVCDIADPVTVTAHKGPFCNEGVRFIFDTAQVQSYLRINDTTLRLTFDKNYSGKVYAEINTCTLLKDSLDITVAGLQELNLGSDTTWCPGSSYLLSAYNPAFQSYTWQDGSTDSVYRAMASGIYYVTATDYCNNVYTDTLRIIKKDFKINLGTDTSVCINQNLSLCVPSGYLQYKWQSAGDMIPASDHCINMNPVENSLYSIETEVLPGCIISDTIQVAVTTCPEYIYFPTSFTPNGDGLNDIFQPAVGAALEKYELLIYNRWGQLIFKTNKEYNGWSGRYNGRSQDTGSFVWLCRYKFYNRPEKLTRGTVTLVK